MARQVACAVLPPRATHIALFYKWITKIYVIK